MLRTGVFHDYGPAYDAAPLIRHRVVTGYRYGARQKFTRPAWTLRVYGGGDSRSPALTDWRRRATSAPAQATAITMTIASSIGVANVCTTRT